MLKYVSNLRNSKKTLSGSIQFGQKILTRSIPKYDTNSRKIQLFDPSPKK